MDPYPEVPLCQSVGQWAVPWAGRSAGKMVQPWQGGSSWLRREQLSALSSQHSSWGTDAMAWYEDRSPSGLCSQQANPALQNRKATSDGIRDWAQAWHLGVGSSMEAPWHNPSSCRGWQGRAGVHWTEQPFLPARTFPGGRWLPVKLFPACRDGAHMCGYRAETVGRWTHMCPPAFSCLPETQSREVTSQAT